jgi:hypothetical protein
MVVRGTVKIAAISATGFSPAALTTLYRSLQPIVQLASMVGTPKRVEFLTNLWVLSRSPVVHEAGAVVHYAGAAGR